MPPAAGEHLGRYTLISPLGKGGMGEVWLADDPRLDRQVAIKVLPEGFAADPTHLSRFEREARLLSRLRHPHVRTVFDVGDEDGQRFLVMERLLAEKRGG
ncbi:MAG TPA: protein kinase [Thermoanaerobaculia bacterium]|nr:protein kinase [Thermoanaerobaculia bacterium]